MMKWVFGGLIITAVIFGVINGNMAEVSKAALESSVSAVELFIYLIGTMAVWGGIMKIAENAGFTDIIAKLFKPLAKRLFKGLDLNGGAFAAICMNVTANILGLGNAATPLGLEAMRRLEEEEKTGDKASRNMVIFILLNTASITLIPTTAAALRLKHGSAAPMEIIPAVWLTSVIALAVGLTVAFLLDKKS